MHLLNLTIQMSDEAVVLVEESPIRHNHRMLHSNQGPHEGLCAVQLSSGIHPHLGEVATHVAQPAHISRGYGSTIRVPTQIKSIITIPIRGHHGTGVGEGCIRRGDAKGEQTCANFMIGRTHEAEVFERHHLGGGYFKGGNIQGDNGSVDCLLQYRTLRYPTREGSPLMIHGGVLITIHSTKQEEEINYHLT
jgi:hypothetical protein